MAYVTGATGGSVGTPGRMVMPHFDPSVLNIDTLGIMSKGFDLGKRMYNARQDREDELKLRAAQIKAAESSASSDALKLKEAEATHTNRVKSINADATLDAKVKERLIEQEEKNYDNYISAAESAAAAEAILKRGAAAQAHYDAKTSVLAAKQGLERQPGVGTELANIQRIRTQASEQMTPEKPYAGELPLGSTVSWTPGDKGMEANINKPAAGVLSRPVSTTVENLKDQDGNDIVDPKTGLTMKQRFNVLSDGSRQQVGQPFASGPTPGFDLTAPMIVDESAPSTGLPRSAPNPYFRMNPEVAKRVQAADAASDTRELQKDENELEARMKVIAELDRFKELNEKTDTGPILSKIPGTKALSENRQKMQQISNLLTPGMRQGLPGAASDRDVQMFRDATVGLDKDKEVNDAIISAYKAQTAREVEYLKFKQDYRSRFGHLRNANAAWKEYVDANKIFDPNSDEAVLNPNIQTREEFFSNKGEDGKPLSNVKVNTSAPQAKPLAPRTGTPTTRRVVQDGVTYEFDGSSWNAVK